MYPKSLQSFTAEFYNLSRIEAALLQAIELSLCAWPSPISCLSAELFALDS